MSSSDSDDNNTKVVRTYRRVRRVRKPRSNRQQQNNENSSELKNFDGVAKEPVKKENNNKEEEEIGENEEEVIGCFGKYLTVWVALCMIFGTLLGYYVPQIAATLEKTTVAQVNIPTAILLWIIIAPMMLQVAPSAILDVRKQPKGIVLTTFMNWCVQPFLMYGLALLFFSLAFGAILDAEEEAQYIAGSVILGGSPCTAMVFVWSSLTHGDPAYTLVQVLVNDVILLFVYAPTVKLLLSLASVEMPWTTIILSVVLFVFVPFAIGLIARYIILRTHDNDNRAVDKIADKFKPLTTVALLAMLVLIFVFQGATLVANWVHVFLIAVPLILQNVVVFFVTYALGYALGLSHPLAAPAAFIASSNFFELGVSVSITAYGLESGAALANVVGVLVEVPVMLSLVYVANHTRRRFNRAPMHRRLWFKLQRAVLGRRLNRVLLLGTSNSCRSQMAEALVNALLGNWIAFSAGTTAPANDVHPLAVAALAERGYDISQAQPKHINKLPADQQFDVIITLFDGDAASDKWQQNPSADKVLQINIEIDDPSASTDPIVFRECLQEIENKILTFLLKNQQQTIK